MDAADWVDLPEAVRYDTVTFVEDSTPRLIGRRSDLTEVLQPVTREWYELLAQAPLTARPTLAALTKGLRGSDNEWDDGDTRFQSTLTTIDEYGGTTEFHTRYAFALFASDHRSLHLAEATTDAIAERICAVVEAEIPDIATNIGDDPHNASKSERQHAERIVENTRPSTNVTSSQRMSYITPLYVAHNEGLPDNGATPEVIVREE